MFFPFTIPPPFCRSFLADRAGPAVPALLTVHFIAVLPEERYLSEKFGESYKVYLTQVRRYL